MTFILHITYYVVIVIETFTYIEDIQANGQPARCANERPARCANERPARCANGLKPALLLFCRQRSGWAALVKIINEYVVSSTSP